MERQHRKLAGFGEQDTDRIELSLSLVRRPAVAELPYSIHSGHTLELAQRVELRMSRIVLS